uniref:Carboxylic ester hydrolase n=1 Tax=Culicoides sonorensis TaxID=179676 RepID=A0A336N0V6_CULSO
MNISNPIIVTKSGPIKGRKKVTDINVEYYSFQNIPYVKTFEGDHVFKDPEIHEPWTEILDCTSEGPAFFNIDPFRSEENLCEGSLKSLGINIFTPDLSPSKPLPVLIFIHGGAFINGSSSTTIYGPDYLIENNIIMVSFNYRLNIYGFLSFDDTNLNIPGNAGLKDQNLALKWIKDNIEVFGGDSNNITLCGQSAGGASVNYHLISPLSCNLFNRAIIMAGSAFCPWASIPLNFEVYMKKLVQQLGLNGDENDEIIFRAICEADPEELLRSTLSIVNFEDKFYGPLLLSPFLPRIEKYDNANRFLPESLKKLSENAWSQDIDVMIGGCSNEGLFYYLCDPTDDDLKKVDDDNSLLLPLDLQKGVDSDKKFEKGKSLKETYFGKDGTVSKEKANEYCKYMADKITWFAKYQTILHRSKGDGKTFLYHIDLPPSNDVPEYYDHGRKLCKIPHRDGMAHAEELPLLFKTQIARRFQEGDDHYNSWRKFMKIFANFIKTGNPNNETIDEGQHWDPIPKNDMNNLICYEMNTANTWHMSQLENLTKLKIWSDLYE